MSEPEVIDVLFVEDNADDAELTLRVLNKHNIASRIRHVRDGAEALTCIFDEEAWRDLKVVFLDLKLPKVDGLQVLERIRADERTRKLPVVILTSSNVERDMDRCYSLGANSFVTKPVAFQDFMDAISQIGLYWMIVNKPPQP